MSDPQKPKPDTSKHRRRRRRNYRQTQSMTENKRKQRRATSAHQVVSDTNMNGDCSNKEKNVLMSIYSKFATVKARSEQNQSADEGPLINDVRKHGYYHGYLPDCDVERLLQDDGDFALYVWATLGPRRLTLALRWMGQVHRVAINQRNDNKIVTDSIQQTFDSIEQLIQFCSTQGLPMPSIEEDCVVRLNRPVNQQYWELMYEQVKLGEFLGGGIHGQVFYGELLTDEGKKVPVAIKMTTKSQDSDTMMHECRLMRQYNHPNIIRFYGMVCKRQPVLVVMELATGGTLVRHLRKLKSKLNSSDLSQYGVDVAKGMEYLHTKQCIHRDLAARNCLLGQNNIVKISDFGLSIEGGFYRMTKAGDIPIRWSAPETLKDAVYTDKTDVWSFGVVLWEIWSEGKDPYTGMKKNETKEKVLSGYRMSQPERMPMEIYDIMAKCWSTSPEQRPPFVRIKAALDIIHQQMIQTTN